jgi:2-iminobutanoate/2-iminopropanoate deaminase
MKNIEAVLKDAGSSLNHIVDVTILLVDIADFAAVNTVYAKYLGDHKPARACYAVKQLPLNSLVEIKVTAYVNS